VAIAGVLAFLGHQIYLAAQAVSLRDFLSRINPTLMVVSFVLTCAALLVSGLLWHYLLRINQAALPLRWSLVIFAYAHFGRYLPGKVWTIVGRVALAAQRGVRPAVATQCAALEAMLGVLSGLSLSLIMLPAVNELGAFAWVGLGVAIVILLVFLHPRVFGSLMNFGLRIFRRKPVDVNYSFGQIACALSLQILGWFTFGMGFFLLVKSIDPASTLSPFTATGAFAGAWVVGYLSLLMPAGLGVREAVLVGLLALWLSPETATAAALVSRLFTTSADFTAIVLAIALGRAGEKS
jgi:uncharacterized membrane protein YbhN (UPF0104 family)